MQFKQTWEHCTFLHLNKTKQINVLPRLPMGMNYLKKGEKNEFKIYMFCIQYSYMLFFFGVCVRLYWHAAEFLSMLSWPAWWTLTTAAKDKLPLDSRRTNTLYFSWLDLNLAYYASCVNDWKHELSWSSLRLTSTEKYTLILSFSHTQSNNTDWTSSPSLNKNVCACRKYDIV